MRLRILLPVGLALVACATPLASARLLAPPSGTVTLEATGPDGAQYTWDDPGSCSPPSPQTFPLGTTHVDCGADGAFDVQVQDTTRPQLNVPGDMTVEAADVSGSPVNYSFGASDAVGVTSSGCLPASGSTFGIGTATVTCSANDAAGNPAAGSFSVTVRDTTPPSFSNYGEVDATTESPSGTAVNFTKPSATDLGQPLTVTCDHDSGSNFGVGTTPVTCSADDARGNRGSVSFNVVVTLVDTTAPVLHDVPTGIAQNTEVASGKVVTFSPTATDNIDGTDPVVCTPGSGSLFPVGTTPVACSATDAHANVATATFNVVIALIDNTKPVLSGVPGNINQTTESPGGKAVTFTLPTANDNLDGPLTVACTPPPGSNFALGSTTVTCSAQDSHNNAQQASFTVTLTLIDATAPVLTGVSPDRVAEANGPTGAIVSFGTPTATDNLDGPIALVGCDPSSGTLFSLGTHLVTCSASDAHSNVGSASFHVTVVDSTPPTLAAPGPTTVYATTPTGIPETAPALIGYRAAATAKDIVDAHPSVTDNLGSFVEIGVHPVGFVARDASGNTSTRDSQLTVLPQPPAGTAPLPLPPPPTVPADVPRLQIFPGDGFVRLVWGAVSGAADYLVYRSENSARRLAADGHGQVVYRGPATTYTDRAVKNGVEYRYVVVSEDAAGNESAGVAAAGRPSLNLLRSPKDGAKLKTPPRLVWTRNAEANYYNVQLFRGQAKILSTWPVSASVRLKRTWKYQGRRYTLAKGVYRWYVWPGFGARAKVDYGELLGSNSFQMTR
jgi:large repetitive protein